MKRTIQILLISAMLALASSVRAQTTESCGIVGIDGPSEVDPGAPLVFKVKVANLRQPSPEFRWYLSLGKIVKGEGTDEITADTTGLGGQVLTATAELMSALSGCKNTDSITTSVKLPPPTDGCAFDSYGDIKFEDEKARLDNFTIQISNYEGSRGIILMYAGQITFKGEAAYRLDRARSYMTNVRGINSSRLITVDCGFRQDLSATLMIVPPEAKLPECTDVGLIPLSEVKFTKPRPKSSKKRQ